MNRLHSVGRITTDRRLMKLSPAGMMSTSRWQQLMTDHTRASAIYRMVSESAASTDNTCLEERADKALQEIAQLEALALAMPAEDIASFRFKLSLWGNGRVEGLEDAWATFSADCERLLLESAASKRRA